MAKRRRARRKTVANRKRTPKLGAEQLREVRPGVAGEAAPHPVDELDSSGRPHQSDEGRVHSERAPDDRVGESLRNLPPDETHRPAQEYLGHWPYTVVDTPDLLAALGEWLLQHGSTPDKTPVGIAATSDELAFATKERGWLLRSWDWPVATSRLLAAMLERLLLAERTGPALVTLDTGNLAHDLTAWWLGEYDHVGLLKNIVHDLTALEYATGRPVLREAPPIKLALDAAVVGPMLALEAPNFYRAVGVPLARHKAQKSHSIPAYGPSWHRWTVSYDWLLFRVLTYYTSDPTLIRWFQEERSPLHELAALLELSSEQATAFLLWLCCGEDEGLLASRHPDWVAHLPESPQLIRAARADKSVPALRLGLIRLVDQFSADPRAHTLYGRRSPWGLTPRELLHFVLLGSVNDLLDVAVVTFCNLGSKIHWLVQEDAANYNHWLRALVVGYTEERPMDWQQKLEKPATLNHPLGVVGLEPRIIVE